MKAPPTPSTDSVPFGPAQDFRRVSVWPPATESPSSPGARVRLPRPPGLVHPLAASIAAPGTRFRLPTFEKLKAAYTDTDLNIPEAVIKERVTELLGRMEREGRLKSPDPVPTIVAKIFPAPGMIDEAEFNNAIDVTDRSKIYQSVTEANTKVKAGDKPALKAAMREGANLIQTVETDAVGLTQVFGTKAPTAKANYVRARRALLDVARDMDAHVTTDYNLDDPEVGLGGWANFRSKKMHLLLEVAQVADLDETKATVIHEAAHLSNPSVDDQVYYAESGFFEADEDKKVANAAHYEELPRRVMGTSKFDTQTFIPGTRAGGGAVTREDNVKAAVNLYMRKAWDAGVDAHSFIREVRLRYERGNTAPFTAKKALILEMSRLMDLTVHEQAADKAIITTLDVSLSESISRGVARVKDLAEGIQYPPKAALPDTVRAAALEALSDTELRDMMVASAVTRYGRLLQDPARDKALLDWLEAHYRSLPDI